MAYEVIIDNKNKVLEIHYDLCDNLLEKKDNLDFVNKNEFISLMQFNEIQEFIGKEEFKYYKVNFCETCKPNENYEEYDEEFDDFYEEFDEDEEFGCDSCSLI